jgi:homospermidine synthase
MTEWPIHARISGPVVMIGFGSIGRGTLPLILRHFDCDPGRITVIDPDDTHRGIAEALGCRFQKLGLTKSNYRGVLAPLLEGPGQGFIVNLSVDVSSVAIIELAQELGVLYIDTVAEPWTGFYTDASLSVSQRSNYALRESILDVRRRRPGGTTAINCCGANPGMVSWLVKQALLNLAADLGLGAAEPRSREEWAELMRDAGVKGIHIAERDTQRARAPKRMGVFVNTWSVEGFISEGLQPAELGWGTHEKALPPDGNRHDFGSGAAIYLSRPGAGTRVRSWAPTPGAQLGFLVTHNEAISIADYYTVRDGNRVVYRPTCHYAYRPADDAVLSLDEMAGQAWEPQPQFHILDENEIVDGIDELGRASLRPRTQCLLVRLPALYRGDAAPCALPECDGAPGDLSRPCRDGLGARESAGRTRRSGRDGLSPLPRSADALSRSGDRRLYRLDARRGAGRAFPGAGRPRRSVAVLQRHCAVM